MYDMYRENILDHSKYPRNKGILQPAAVDVEGDNPLCGDRLRLTLRLDDQRRVTEIGWDGEGCAISQASASMLGELMIGKTLDEIKTFDKDLVFDLLGIPLSMNRVKCGLLSLKTLTLALYRLGELPRPTQEEDEDE